MPHQVGISGFLFRPFATAGPGRGECPGFWKRTGEGGFCLRYRQPIKFRNSCNKKKKKTRAFPSSPTSHSPPPPSLPSPKNEVLLLGSVILFFFAAYASSFSNTPKDMSIKVREPTSLFSFAQTPFNSINSHHQLPKPRYLYPIPLSIHFFW